jgi:hypothetical protein
MNIQTALNAILEISENKLDEGSYLEVSNQLKILFDESQKKPVVSKRKVITRNRILTEETISRKSRHIFEMTHEEKVAVMRSRAMEHSFNLTDTLAQVKDDISSAIREKKQAWESLKNARKARSLSLKECSETHKGLVQKEKFLKLALTGFKHELYELENLFHI